MVELIQLDGNAIAECLATSLESMAFISVMPAELPCPSPTDATLVRINFSGPMCGALEMMAPRELGALLHSNIVGEPGVDVSLDQAEDALKEIMNVVCGALLRGVPGATQFEISLPRATSAGDEAWTDFIQSDGAVVIDAESNIVAVRIAPLS